VKVWLHYIGGRLYTKRSFIAEANRHGVCRTLPISVVKSLKWNEIILLAFYKPKVKGSKAGGTAEVFGYFRASRINHNLPLELTKKLLDELDVESTATGGYRVDRRCGSYYVGAIIYVRNELDETVRAIEEVAKEANYKVRVMVCGPFTELEPFYITDIPFTRGLLKVDVDEALISPGAAPDKSVTRIFGYKQLRGGKVRKEYKRTELLIKLLTEG